MSSVLIVDDSSTMRKIITRSLRQAGFDLEVITEAGDGHEGLSALEKVTVDLILSDINMPNMDGLEFVKRVRARGIMTPIVMITTEGGEDVIRDAMSSGASSSIRKPFTPAHLQEKLGRYL
jgi:two-component system, chemotaxis family, chemotaxis protein CheY